jgi:hypothetical protein
MTAYHWFALFVAVNVLDAGLTLYALRQGASEVNPLMRLAMRVMPAPVALLLVKGVYVVAVGVMLAQLAPWMPWLVAFFGAVCLWNIGQILRARKT